MPRCSIETKEDKAFQPENITMIHAPVMLNGTDAALIHEAIRDHCDLGLVTRAWMLGVLRDGSSIYEQEESLAEEEALSNAFLENAI